MACLRRKAWTHWRWEAFGWRGSVMFGRYRPGARQITPGVWSVATPLVLLNVIRPWKPARTERPGGSGGR